MGANVMICAIRVDVLRDEPLDRTAPPKRHFAPSRDRARRVVLGGRQDQLVSVAAGDREVEVAWRAWLDRIVTRVVRSSGLPWPRRLLVFGPIALALGIGWDRVVRWTRR